LAEFLDIPKEIINRVPTTDTYSLPQGQDEFYFHLPYDKMDFCLYGKNNNIDPGHVGGVIGLTAKQVKLIYDDIDQKRRTTKYLHLPPLLVDQVHEIVYNL
jgi:NAD+ synthase